MSVGTPVARVVLARGRERPFVGRHPWVFSGAVDRVEGQPADGDAVQVVDAGGTFVAHGLWNAQSQIRVRLYAWTEGARLDDAFFEARLDAALAYRRTLGMAYGPRDAGRLVFSEADGMSGLVVDRYGDWLSVQLTSLALARRREALLDLLEARLAPRGIFLRTEKGILEEEGLAATDGLLRGAAPDGPVPIREGDLTYLVDLATGQKTGFFLDQRDNRRRAAAWAEGRRVADVFCYTGGFTLAALAGGASSVVGVDGSAPALALAERNLEASELADGRARFEASDAFRWLEARAEAGDAFGLVVLDPPRFARSSRGVAQALRGYARLNELGVRCLEPGGILVTCSCTGRVSREAFAGVLAEVEVRTGRRIRVLEARGQAPDHPVSPTCPESEYLKCFICRVE